MNHEYRLALVTPIHPMKTGIADWIEEMLPYLRDALGANYRIDLFVEHVEPSNPDVAAHHQVYDIDLFERMHDQYDLCIYQMGNNQFHVRIYDLALRYPGIVIEHDFAIHHMVAYRFLDVAKDDVAYFDEVGYNHGEEARKEAYQRAVNGKLGLWETDAVDYPMNKRLVDTALGMVVFSQFAKERMEAYGSNTPIQRIYLHCSGKAHRVTKDECEQARKRLSIALEQDETLICVMGFIGKSKRPDSILKAVADLTRQGKKIRICYVGKLQDDCKDFPKKIERLGLKNKVRITGFTTIQEFEDYIFASDICISLRYPTMGETSGVLMRAMSAGKPSIVTNIGTFCEMPDDAVLKIDYREEREVAELKQAISELITCPERYQSMSEQSYQYAKAYLEIDATANSLADFLKDAAAFNRIRDNAAYQKERDEIILSMMRGKNADNSDLHRYAVQLAEEWGNCS